MMIGAAQAGKHIFCEKPLARTIEEARRAVAAVEQAGVTMVFGVCNRLAPMVRRARQIVPAPVCYTQHGASRNGTLRKYHYQLTQHEQVRCFENVAAHLTDDGAFVVEAYVPAFLCRLRNDQYVEAEAIEAGEVRLDVLRHDAAAQVIEESHVSLSAAGVRLNPVVQRYAWPSELDLMARIAGLRLKARWGGWDREPFNATSALHVSVYGR